MTVKEGVMRNARAFAALEKLGTTAYIADLMVREALLNAPQLMATGAAYGLVLAMRHPEYAQALFRGMVDAADEDGDFNGTALALVVDRAGGRHAARRA